MENEKKTIRLSGKVIALALTLVLTVGGVVGGTVAWLIASPDPVVNTFTYGDINITLTETDTTLDDDDNPNTNDYKMLPGQTIEKDPIITVEKGSEDMWLFVKLVESDNFDDFLTYKIARGWTALDETNYPGVYYRAVSAEDVKDDDETYRVIWKNQVTVNNDVTKDMLNALDSGDTDTYPTLTVTAYAMQYVGFEPEVSDGATESTTEQITAAAVKAWTKVTESQTTTP